MFISNSFYLKLADGLISWTSRVQKTIAYSSTEAELGNGMGVPKGAGSLTRTRTRMGVSAMGLGPGVAEWVLSHRCHTHTHRYTHQ